MAKYFYKLTPLLVVGTVVVLSMPWLGLIAAILLPLAALAAVGALAWAIAFVPYTLIRSISPRRRMSIGVTPQTVMDLLPAGSVQTTDTDETDAAPTSHALFIVPTRRGDGFMASIHRHTLELADPTDDRLAPSSDDLLIASIASDLASSARSLLRANGLPDDVSVCATWRTTDGRPRLGEIGLTVAMSRRAESVGTALATAFESRLVARSLSDHLVHISFEGAHR